MKIIPKYNLGGVTNGGPPLMDFQPLATRVPQTVEQPKVDDKKDAKSEEGIFPEYMAKALMEKGLTNEVDAYMTSIESAMGGNMLDPFHRSKSTSMIKQISKIIQNKDNLDAAIKVAVDNKALDSAVVDGSGRVLVQDETGSLKQVTPDEFANNKDKYSIVNNGDLIRMRRNDPSLAYDTKTISMISNGISMNNITEYVNKVLDKVGSITNTNATYMGVNVGELQDGLKQLVAQGKDPGVPIATEGAPDGVYRITRETKSNSGNLQTALHFLERTLSPNAVTLLKVTAAQRNLDPDKGMAMVLQDMMGLNLTQEIKTTPEFDSAATKLAKGLDDDGKSTSPYVFQNNILGGIGKHVVYNLNPGGKYNMAIKATQLNGFYTYDQKPMDTFSSMRELIGNSFGSLVNSDNVYFGDNKIDANQLDKVLWTGKAGGVGFMPISQEDPGHIKPDLHALDRMQDADKEILSKHITDPKAKAQVYKNHDLAFAINARTGYIDKEHNSRFKRFLIIPSVAKKDDNVLKAPNDIYMKYVEDSKGYVDVFNNKVVLDPKHKKEYAGGYWAGKGIFNSDNDFYEANVFIPVEGSEIDATFAGGHTLMGNKNANSVDFHKRLDQINEANETLDGRVYGSNALGKTVL